MMILQFDWDIWNIQKNEEKHGISSLEAESVFYDHDLVIFEDIKHSRVETMWVCYGVSVYNKVLMLAYTVRKAKIRIISARRASAKETKIYEENK